MNIPLIEVPASCGWIYARRCAAMRSARALAVVFTLPVLSVLSACAGYAPHEPAPTTTAAPLARYKIGPLDTLNIVVWRNPELSSTLAVRPDGMISTPLVEDMLAAGKTPAELSREIEKALAKYIRDPVVTIVVGGFQGDYADQVRVVGEAVKPQSMPYRPNMTLLDAMTQAGGMTAYANGNGAVLVRSADGDKRYSVRLKDLLTRGDITANVPVAPGDIIIVPQGWF